MTIQKTPHHLRPISWVALTFPSFAGRHSCFPRRTYLAYSVPPGVRGLQGHNVAHPKLAQRPFETLILTVERVGHHRTKRDALFRGRLHQLGGYLQFGAKLRVLLASPEVVGGGVGLEVNGPVDLLICKQAAYADHPAFGLADVGQPLPAYMGGSLAPLAVSVLVYDQDALLARRSRALALCSANKSSSRRSLTSLGSHPDSERNHCRLCASLRCAPFKGSVLARAVRVLLRSAGSAFRWKQKALQAATKALALSASPEEIIEAGREIFERSRGRRDRKSFGHGGTSW